MLVNYYFSESDFSERYLIDTAKIHSFFAYLYLDKSLVICLITFLTLITFFDIFYERVNQSTLNERKMRPHFS